MERLLLLFDGMMFGVLTLLIVQFWLYHRQYEFTKWIIAFMLALIAYISLSLSVELPLFLQYIRFFMVVNIPAFFWFICLFIFSEQKSLKPVHFLAILVGILSMGNGEFIKSSNILFVSFAYLTEILKIAILGCALWLVISHWKDDLVESRRRIRWLLALTIGLYVFVTMFVQLFIVLVFPSILPIYDMINASLILILTLVVANWMIGPGLSQFIATLELTTSPPTKDIEPEKLSEADSLALKKLKTIIEQDKVYRENGLTIGKLAHQLDLKEHFLRRLINKRLGYRNFNDYLNQYRIAEIRLRLSDSSQNNLPILSIVLDVGYSSLTPFNRAFKLAHNQTPSEFRRLSQDK